MHAINIIFFYLQKNNTSLRMNSRRMWRTHGGGFECVFLDSQN